MVTLCLRPALRVAIVIDVCLVLCRFVMYGVLMGTATRLRRFWSRRYGVTYCVGECDASARNLETATFLYVYDVWMRSVKVPICSGCDFHTCCLGKRRVRVASALLLIVSL